MLVLIKELSHFDLVVSIDELTLVNPIVTERSDKLVVYYEKDLVKNKTRKTARHSSFSVETDNLGLVEFKADKSSWKNNDEFMARYWFV